MKLTLPFLFQFPKTWHVRLKPSYQTPNRDDFVLHATVLYGEKQYHFVDLYTEVELHFSLQSPNKVKCYLQ